jgi:hypothetical protein
VDHTRAAARFVSRRPVAVGVLVAAVVLVAVLDVGGHASTPVGPGAPTAPAVTTGGRSPSGPPVTGRPPLEGDDAVSPVPVDTTAAVDVAAAFTAAWAHPARRAAAWLAAVRPYTDPGLYAELAKVDPSAVPATKVTGAPQVLSVASNTALVSVPTDAGTVLVYVSVIGGRTVVTGLDRAAGPGR